jgi:prepilin-type N-terminal cleavage/methylation domain-containing protein
MYIEMLNKLHSRQNGDTIIEVLISLAILALVLGGASYTANQSYRNDRDSQEHTEALTIAQTQLEDLRSYKGTFNPNPPYYDTCLTLPSSAGVSALGGSVINTGGCWVASNNSTPDPPGTAGKSLCLSTAPYCYQVTVTPLTPVTINNVTIGGNTPPSVTAQTYEADVSWSALGGGTDSVTLYYRVDN